MPARSFPQVRPHLAILIIGLLIGVLGACSDGETVRASHIVCSTAYRLSSSDPLTDVDTMTLQDEDATQSIPYIYLELHASYTTGNTDGERSLRLWVTPTGEDRVLVNHLFQLPADSGPADQFVGDHGFTGLASAFDPVSGAELQYWCQTG